MEITVLELIWFYWKCVFIHFSHEYRHYDEENLHFVYKNYKILMLVTALHVITSYKYGITFIYCWYSVKNLFICTFATIACSDFIHINLLHTKTLVFHSVSNYKKIEMYFTMKLFAKSTLFYVK